MMLKLNTKEYKSFDTRCCLVMVFLWELRDFYVENRELKFKEKQQKLCWIKVSSDQMVSDYEEIYWKLIKQFTDYELKNCLYFFLYFSFQSFFNWQTSLKLIPGFNSRAFFSWLRNMKSCCLDDEDDHFHW